MSGIPEDVLLDALLRKLGSSCSALTSFKLRVRLADDVECALTFDHLAVFVAALH